MWQFYGENRADSVAGSAEHAAKLTMGVPTPRLPIIERERIRNQFFFSG